MPTLRAIFCKIRTSAWHGTSSIWLIWPFVSRIAEKAGRKPWLCRYFTIRMLGQYESMPSHLTVSSPSQFSSDRDIVNISDIADIAFLFLGIQGKSAIFFNFGFITLVKRHGSPVEVWRLVYTAFSRHFTRHITSRGTQPQFSENIYSEDDLRSRIFGTFVVKLLACLPLLRFSNI